MIFQSSGNGAIKILKSAGVGIIPTDTIYGIVGTALNKKTVSRIYRLRKRNLKKPMIILIGQVSDLKKFGINQKPKTWPTKTSIVFPCGAAKFKYLHRGTKTLAFRLPNSKKFREFLKQTGPLVAPSANLEGESPAKTIKEAKKYFGNKVDFYIDAGKLISKPSRVIFDSGNKVQILRK